jgi:hypothetical protein
VETKSRKRVRLYIVGERVEFIDRAGRASRVAPGALRAHRARNAGATSAPRKIAFRIVRASRR